MKMNVTGTQEIRPNESVISNWKKIHIVKKLGKEWNRNRNYHATKQSS